MFIYVYLLIKIKPINKETNKQKFQDQQRDYFKTYMIYKQNKKV